MLNLDEPFRNQDNFIITLFTLVQIWVLRVTFFFAVFGGPAYFCGSGSGSRMPKSCGSNGSDPKHWKNMSK